MKKVRGLGRGLDALLGGEPAAAPAGAPTSLPIAKLRAGRYQPRTKMNAEALAELAESIKAQGVLEPLIVAPLNGTQYTIIAGHRRREAARKAGLLNVPCWVLS
ncbi:MAG: ParB N-terminal domain-containing protein, partial [Burkholderiaceae bacterium]|nr:ParB N-terminal domain-containing protein [Burkholderiaceae bacterium]